MSIRKAAGEGSRGIALFVGGVVVVLLALAVIVVATGLWQRATVEFRGETAEREQIVGDPRFRIAAYEEFFDRCAAVQSAELQVANLSEERDGVDDGTARAQQLDAAITAQRNRRVELITEYNSAATQEDTRARFQSSDLPYQLDPNDEETQCAAS